MVKWKKEDEYINATALVCAQEEYVADIQAKHDIAFLRVLDGSVVGSAKGDEVSGDEAQSVDNEPVSG